MSVAIPAAAQSYPGFDAGQMLADPVRNNVYVLDQTNHKVIEISTDLGRKIGQANVSDVPTSLAINPQGTELYVSSRQANAIQVYALPDLQPLRTLDVSQPGLIAVGIGDRVFVAGTSQWGSLRQVDGISGTLLHTFGSYYDALPKTSVAGTKLYLSELGLSTTDTDEYDISNPNITPASVKSYATNMSNGRDLAIDEKYNRLYSMSGGVYGVYHVDRATGTGGTWSFGGAAYGASVDVNEAASWFYATAQDPYNGGIFKYDRATGAVLTQYAPNGGYQSVWDVAETANGNAIYLADPGYSGSGQQLGIIGKTSLAIASIPNAAFTTSVSSGRVVSFDASASADYEANGTIASYVWDFGDGTTANGKTAGHTYAANGKYVIKLTVADAQGNTDDYSTTLNLSTAPVAANAVYTTQEETAVAVPLQGTDSDGDALTYAIAEQPAHGKLQLSGTTATYIPAKDFFGDDRFVYTVSDGGSTTAATVVIRVNNVNDAPVARDDLVARSPAGATLINVLGNDIDPDGDPLTITFTQPANGGVQLSGNKLLYTPAAGFVGADNFTYTISDGTATSSAKAYVSPQAATLSGEWTTFGGSAAHTGAFAGVTGPAAPVNGWAVLNDGNTTTLAVAVGNGRVFATQYTPSGYALSAYDATNGQLLWKHSFTSGFSINPPTYYNGRVYLTRCNHSSDTQLWAIDANTGNTIWSAAFQAQWESYYAPAVDASGIWINGGSYGGMYGFQHNGTQIKYIGLAQYDEWTPSILNGSVYSYVAGSFVKYDETGTASWTNTKSWSWNGWSMNRTTALAGNQAFLVGNPDFYSVNLTTGQTLWTVAGSFTGTAAVSGNTAYVIQGSTVKAYNTANGQLVNTYTTTDSLQLQPIVTDDSVIVASTSNTYVFDRATGKLRYMLAYGGQLSLANNRLIVAAPDGVHSFDFASPLAADAGSTYHVNEGASVTLSGAASSAGGAVSAWEWDFDYDGTTFNVDATGQNVTFSAANIDGPGRRRVALRVRDAAGNVSPVAGADVLIDNVAPTAAFAVTPTVMVGGVSVAQFSAPTDSAVDQAFGLRYSFDFNNDGDFTDTGDVVNSTSPTASYAFGAAGTYTVHGQITDIGGASTDYTATTTVTTVTPPTDPATVSLEAETALFSGGTVKDASHLGFTGTGYADLGGTGSAIKWTFSRNGAGTVTLAVRYANGGTTDRPLNVVVNGVTVGTLPMKPTGGWSNWVNATIAATLTAGVNTVSVIGSTSANANVDSLTISTGATPPPPPPGSMSGFTFDDTDKDGVYDATETKTAGKTVFIDLDGDGALDANEQSVLTGAGGAWSFAAMPPGSYAVRQVFASGTALSTPLINVTLATGQVVAGLSIGTKSTAVPPPPPGNASISGTAFNDNNSNAKYDAGDGIGKGVTMFLDTDNDGVLDSNEKSVISDNNGKFTFTGLAAGTYRVRPVFAAGQTYSTPLANITLTAGQVKTGVLVGTKKV